MAVDPCVPCWFTKCQAEQVRKLIPLVFELIDEEDLYDDLDLEIADKVDDWQFIAYLPATPTLFDEYPRSDQCNIYALCNGAIFCYYGEFDSSDYAEGKGNYDYCKKLLESAKQAVREVAQSYTAHVKQLCLV